MLRINQLQEERNFEILHHTKTQFPKIDINKNLTSNKDIKEKYLRESTKSNINSESISKLEKESDQIKIYNMKRNNNKKKTYKGTKNNLKKNILKLNESHCPSNEEIEEKNKKASNNSKGKKVSFLPDPDFVTVIQVESYKQYNQECNDKNHMPNFGFIRDFNIFNDYDNDCYVNCDQYSDDGKERLNCTCSVF